MPARSYLPGGRAVVGGLLMAVAAVGTFVAWGRAGDQEEVSYVVAARPIVPGERLGPSDVQLAPVGVAPTVAGFTDPDDIVGRVVRGPLAEGELVQPGLLGQETDEDVFAELSFALPRDRAVDGRLGSGDRIDIFVTDQERTRLAATSVPIVTVNEPTGPAATGTGQVVLTVGFDQDVPAELVHALHAGEVTLVRSVEESP